LFDDAFECFPSVADGVAAHCDTVVERKSVPRIGDFLVVWVPENLPQVGGEADRADVSVGSQLQLWEVDAFGIGGIVVEAADMVIVASTEHCDNQVLCEKRRIARLLMRKMEALYLASGSMLGGVALSEPGANFVA
jgi:hypothetical protein